MLLVTIIGWHVAGCRRGGGNGGRVRAVVHPQLFVVRVWQRFRGAPWRRVVEAGLAPITVGLCSPPAAGDGRRPGGWVAYSITAGTTVLVLLTRINPVWLFAAAGVLAILGLCEG